MSVIRLLATNSTIYAGTNVLQRGSAFLLLPLYTAFLDPAAYGVLAVVTAVNGLLSILFTFGLTGAVSRFYFEFQDDPQQLAEFWGTVLVFVLILSISVGAIFLVYGDVLLRPIIADIPFRPYVALGVMSAFFQPFFAAFLAILQTRNQASRYAIISLSHFVLTTALTIMLVVALELGVRGALTANLVASAVFFGVSLWLLRSDITLCLRWRYLRPALAYSLPQVPHSMSGQITATTDRLFLNAHVGTTTTGVYAVGSMVAMVVEVAAQSVNRAYVPLSMAALKDGSSEALTQLRTIGALLVAAFCMLGATIGLFAPEILWALASPAFASAASAVPILAFCGVASSVYYLFVNILFFDRVGVRLLPVGTFGAAALNVGLVFLLVPRFGMVGAAWAAVLAQILATVLIALIGRRFDPVRWDYGLYAVAFLLSFGVSMAGVIFGMGIGLATFISKLGLLVLLALLLGHVFWRQPFILLTALASVLARKPSEAASLFMSTRQRKN